MALALSRRVDDPRPLIEAFAQIAYEEVDGQTLR